MKHKFIMVMLLLFTQLFVFSGADAHPATGIVLDRTGNVYFSDLETVWKIDNQGRLSVFRAGVSGRHVHELTIDAQDNIYGADISYVSEKWLSDVWKMTPAGTISYLLAPTTEPPRDEQLVGSRWQHVPCISKQPHEDENGFAPAIT
ncbi:MAG: hypothetical protein H0U60_10745 [Blastocatellia bacterium]|nr:hypothetical protein [Blastocatellia bacterium]